jgi:hypothetical protein
LANKTETGQQLQPVSHADPKFCDSVHGG